MMNEEKYLLTKLNEECLEVAQRVTKALTFGIEDIQEGQELNNRTRLLYELDDLATVIALLVARKSLPRSPLPTHEKVAKLVKYSHLSVKNGMLDKPLRIPNPLYYSYVSWPVIAIPEQAEAKLETNQYSPKDLKVDS